MPPTSPTGCYSLGKKFRTFKWDFVFLPLWRREWRCKAAGSRGYQLYMEYNYEADQKSCSSTKHFGTRQLENLLLLKSAESKVCHTLSKKVERIRRIPSHGVAFGIEQGNPFRDYIGSLLIDLEG